MPIYEYQATNPGRSCDHCRDSFEMLQGLREDPLKECPGCGNEVRKIISWCRAAVVEGSEEQAQVTGAVKDYESAGMWSHAAELADTHAKKTDDQSMKNRALENYKKAGYDSNSLSKLSE
ncbi:FmdB family zinc ribbon protein [Thermodesulfobacteriota bacterium]